LEAAGVPAQPEITGKSLLGLLMSRGPAPAHRDHLLTGKERHAWVRQGGLGYPCRALRTDDYLYIRNFKPERWPAGDPEPGGDNDRTFGDIDDGPTKSFMRGSPDPQVRRLWVLAVAKRPAEELYDLNSDPDELINLADDPRFAETKQRFAIRLMRELAATGDPRASGGGDEWDGFQYYGRSGSQRRTLDQAKNG
jgi:N-sulfoglucosamine sulfohydrolase